jgi:hypothetical protein
MRQRNIILARTLATALIMGFGLARMYEAQGWHTPPLCFALLALLFLW